MTMGEKQSKEKSSQDLQPSTGTTINESSVDGPQSTKDSLQEHESDTSHQLAATDTNNLETLKRELQHESSQDIKDSTLTAMPQLNADVKKPETETDQTYSLQIFDNHFSVVDSKTVPDIKTPDKAVVSSMSSSLPVGTTPANKYIRMSSSLTIKEDNRSDVQVKSDLLQKDELTVLQNQPEQQEIVPLLCKDTSSDALKQLTQNENFKNSLNDHKSLDKEQSDNTEESKENVCTVASPQNVLKHIDTHVTEVQTLDCLYEHSRRDEENVKIPPTLTEKKVNISDVKVTSFSEPEQRKVLCEKPFHLQQSVQMNVQSEPMEINIFQKRTMSCDQEKESSLVYSVPVNNLDSVREPPQDKQDGYESDDTEYYQNFPAGQKANVLTKSHYSVCTLNNETLGNTQTKGSDIPKEQQNIPFSVLKQPSTSPQIKDYTEHQESTLSDLDPSDTLKVKGDNSAGCEHDKSRQMNTAHSSSSSYQMAYKELQAICDYINELKVSNRSVLRKLTEENRQYEISCAESNRRVADLDHCLACLEQRIQQRENQIQQLSHIIQHLLQKVIRLGEVLESVPEVPSASEEEEGHEVDSDVEDAQPKRIGEGYSGGKIVPIQKRTDGFRCQNVLYESDNRHNFKIDGMPKSRRMRRMALSQAAEKTKLGFAGVIDNDSLKVDHLNQRAVRRKALSKSTGKEITGAKSGTKLEKSENKKMVHTGGRTSHVSPEDKKSEDKRKSDNTNIPNVQKRSAAPRKTKRNSTLLAEPVRNPFRNTLTSATEMTEGRQGPTGLTMDLNGWISLANMQMQSGNTSTTRGHGPDTVLCLDVSESMAGKPFTRMIELANQFVDGIQEMNLMLGIEQNVALVTFGHSTTVVQHMTNDYSLMKEHINSLSAGGPSPMVAGLLMCIAAAVGNGAVCVTREFHIQPEIIIISDGRATDLSVDVDPGEGEMDSMSDWQIRGAMVAVMHDIKNRNYPISYIGVGNFHKEHLKQAAFITGGKEIKPDYLPQVIKYHKNFVIAIQLKKDLQHQGLDMKDKELAKSIVRGICSDDVTSRDIDDILEIMGDPDKTNVKRTEGQDSVADELGLNHKELKDSNMPPIGTRVRRGPDWSWDNQDTDGPGTVVSHMTNDWIWVLWDNGHRNKYCYGKNGKYDVIVVDEPRILKDYQQIEVGCLVKRGSDWTDDNDDGGDGNVGVVISVHDNTTVEVRWPNTKLGKYKYSRDGKRAVVLCDPSEYAARMLEETLTASATGGHSTQDVKANSDDQKLQEKNARNKIIASSQTVHSEAKTDDSLSHSDTKTADRSQRMENLKSEKRGDTNLAQSYNKISGHGSQNSIDDMNIPTDLMSTANQTVFSNIQTTSAHVNRQSRTDNGRSNDQPSPGTEKQEQEQVNWEYKDGYGGWTCFSDENSKKIEKVYSKNPSGLTLINMANAKPGVLCGTILSGIYK